MAIREIAELCGVEPRTIERRIYKSTVLNGKMSLRNSTRSKRSYGKGKPRPWKISGKFVYTRA
jgi:IS30 family transposase